MQQCDFASAAVSVYLPSKRNLPSYVSLEYGTWQAYGEFSVYMELQPEFL